MSPLVIGSIIAIWASVVVLGLALARAAATRPPHVDRLTDDEIAKFWHQESKGK